MGIRVEVKGARNLAPKDEGGFSDPYCEAGLAGPDGNFLNRKKVVRSSVCIISFNIVLSKFGDYN